MNWLRDQRTRVSLIGWALLFCLLALSIVRFVGSGLLPATQSIIGDFAATFPTRYFAQLRPDFPTNQVWPGWQYGPMVHFLTLPLFLVPRWSLVPSAWAIVNLGAIVASFILVRRLASAGRISMASTAILAAAWMAYQPLANCFAQGNIEIVEMALILGAIVALPRWKGWVSGVLIGVATMTKLLPVGFLFWFLLRRHYRAFLSGLATITVIIAVTTVTLGWKDSVIFKQIAVAVGTPDGTLHNLSVTSLFLHRTSVLLHNTDVHGNSTGPVLKWFPSERASAAARAGTLASVLLAAGFALALFFRRHRPASPNEVAVLFMTMFMILPYNEDYYYLFALVPLSVLFLSGVERRDTALLTTTFAGYFLISPPLPFNWIDRTGWLPLNFSEVFNYLDLPILGALLVWLAATHRMFAETQDAVVPSDRWGTRGKLVAVAAITVGIAALGFFVVSRTNVVTRPTVDTLSLQPPVVLSGPPALALSPDGAYLAYVAPRGGVHTLCVHAMERATTTCIPGTDEAAGPFFSPDSRWIGFFAGRSLKKVPVDGRAVQLISESRGGRIGEWESDGTILLATPTNGIMRVSASGGNMDVVVPPLGSDGPYSWPMLLPSGDTVLFTVPPPGGGFGAGWITAYSFSTGQRTLLFPGSQPHFDEATGRLTYTLSGRILSVAFDPASLKSSGPSVPLVGNVLVTPGGGPQVAYGGRGTVVYAPGSLLPVVRRQLAWVDREGTVVPLPIPADAFQTPRVSPDGRTLVVGIRGVTTDLWKYDLATGSRSRLTFTAATNDTPVWTPDGWIAFTVPLASGTRAAVLVAPVGGTELDASRLWDGEGTVRLGAWSASGRTLVGTQLSDLWILDTSTTGTPLLRTGRRDTSSSPRDRWRTILAQTTPIELGPVFSPDGRYIAYSSNESGRPEIYVQALLGFSDRQQVSTTGGSEPVWAHDGRELFYRSDNAMMVVSVDSRSTFSAGPPRVLFRGSYFAGDGLTNYDVTPDGRRFLMLREDAIAPSKTTDLIIARHTTSRPASAPAER